jgi:phosphopantothenoylcysteine decarboxylase/phosphopantothenate--cysteine ligase
MGKKNILFILSGSIACFKACGLISRLAKEGCGVKAVCTKNALQFIGLATLEGLTGKPVYHDMFAGREAGTEHISLTKWADITLVCQASGDIINKMAAGIGDDCATTLFLSHDFNKPFVIAPAMNQNIYTHPATQAALAKLKVWGVEVLPTAEGRLACGDAGPGRMLEPAAIRAALEKYL